MIENQTWMIGILKFSTKNNLLAYLVRSGLKFIYHWNVQVLILAKSLFKSMADLVIFSITENRDVSSANNCGLDPKSSDKTGPSIEPYGTPASIAAHEEYCPFRATLCYRWYKKYVATFNKLPDISFSLSLWKIPSWRTLSKAFDMSRNTPLVS